MYDNKKLFQNNVQAFKPLRSWSLKMTQHKWFTGNYRRIVWVCFTILRNQSFKLRQVLLLKKQKEITLLYVVESFCNFWDFSAPGSKRLTEQRDNDTFLILVTFLFKVIYLSYTELEQVHTYFIPTLCPFTSSKSTA